jgi:hypothetical protein
MIATYKNIKTDKLSSSDAKKVFISDTGKVKSFLSGKQVFIKVRNGEFYLTKNGKKIKFNINKEIEKIFGVKPELNVHFVEK